VVIGKGCIVSVSAVVDHDSMVSDFSHIDCGVILPPRTYVGSYRKVSVSITEVTPKLNFK